MRIGAHLDAERYIYPYGEYAVYHIAQVCIDNGGVKRFCHPALEVLLRHDAQYGTSFTDSLYTYIRQFKNITNTANALHLHRNTLVYHLKRIEEIMDVRLSDYNVMQLLELSFRILEYDGKIERKQQWDDVPEREQ
jgi:DNA-binding PucR family transcriptional regulator